MALDLSKQETERHLDILKNGTEDQKKELLKELEEHEKKTIEERFDNFEKAVEKGLLKRSDKKEYTTKYMSQYLEILVKNTEQLKNNGETVVFVTQDNRILNKRDKLMERHPLVRIYTKQEGYEKMMEVISEKMSGDDKETSYIG